jgi:hypothetical protein
LARYETVFRVVIFKNMASKYHHIVDCFCRGEKTRLHQMLFLCNTLKRCVYGIEINQNGKRIPECSLPVCPNDCFKVASDINAHQKRIPKRILDAFHSRVRSLNFSKKFEDFEELYDYVAANSGLSKKHCLLVYDFCLRKGYHLSPQVLPEKYVYLFRGAKEGASAILGIKYRGHKFPTTILQSILDTKMKSFEIEHFLCVCKDCLKSFGAISNTELMKVKTEIANIKRQPKRLKESRHY